MLHDNSTSCVTPNPVCNCSSLDTAVLHSFHMAYSVRHSIEGCVCHAVMVGEKAKKEEHAELKDRRVGLAAASRCSSCRTGPLSAPSCCVWCAFSVPSHGNAALPLSISTTCTTTGTVSRIYFACPQSLGSWKRSVLCTQLSPLAQGTKGLAAR